MIELLTRYFHIRSNIPANDKWQLKEIKKIVDEAYLYENGDDTIKYMEVFCKMLWDKYYFPNVWF
jgi:hypothetical protein